MFDTSTTSNCDISYAYNSWFQSTAPGHALSRQVTRTILSCDLLNKVCRTSIYQLADYYVPVSFNCSKCLFIPNWYISTCHFFISPCMGAYGTSLVVSFLRDYSASMHISSLSSNQEKEVFFKFEPRKTEAN